MEAWPHLGGERKENITNPNFELWKRRLTRSFSVGADLIVRLLTV